MAHDEQEGCIERTHRVGAFFLASLTIGPIEVATVAH